MRPGDILLMPDNGTGIRSRCIALARHAIGTVLMVKVLRLPNVRAWETAHVPADQLEPVARDHIRYHQGWTLAEFPDLVEAHERALTNTADEFEGATHD